MKIIQSYWTRPTQGPEVVGGRKVGGWLSHRHQYMGMYLSCLLLRRHYSQVELVTDEEGKSILIDQLNFPYTSVSTCLNKLDSYPVGLWSLPKLYAYSIQNEPFIHVDGDFFVFKPFGKELMESPLIAQSPEKDYYGSYHQSLSDLQKAGCILPESLKFLEVNPDETIAINAGIFGGNDTGFIKQCIKQAFDIIDNNLSYFENKDRSGSHNIVIEQLLFYKLAQKADKAISYAVPVLSKNFEELLRFDQVPNLANYVHLIGSIKSSRKFCEQVELRLKYEFPREYKKIDSILKSLYREEAKSNEKYSQSTFDKGFSKTRKQLSLLAPQIVGNFADDYKLNYKIIEKLVNDNTEPMFHFLTQLFQLETVYNKIYDKQSSVNHNRFKSINRAYKFLDNASQDDIMNVPISLSKNYLITEVTWPLAFFEREVVMEKELVLTDISYYVLVGIDNAAIFIKELSFWDLFLIYFQDNIITGNELCCIIENEELLPFSGQDLRLKVSEFLTNNLVMTGSLSLI